MVGGRLKAGSQKANRSNADRLDGGRNTIGHLSPNCQEPQNTEQGMPNHEVFLSKPFDILRFLVGYSAVSSGVSPSSSSIARADPTVRLAAVVGGKDATATRRPEPIWPPLRRRGRRRRVGFEEGEVVGLFADADVLHRQADGLANGHDDAALGGAVELGQDDAGALDGLGEMLGLADPFWPVVASRRRMTSWGASGICFPRTRWILVSSFMRFCWV